MKKSDDKLKIRDNGKRKKTVSSSSISNDSNQVSIKKVSITKPNMTKTKYDSTYAKDVKLNDKQGNVATGFGGVFKKEKETPKVKSVSYLKKDYNPSKSEGITKTDSSYKSVIKKPTETKSGSIKIKASGPSTNIKTKKTLPPTKRK